MPLVRIYAPVVYLCAYLAAIVLGRLAVLEASGLALFWPAAGVAALWMLRGTTTRQVALDAVLLFVSTALMHFLLGVDPLASTALAAANTAQGLVVRGLRSWWRGLRFLGPLAPRLTSGRSWSRLSCSP